MGAGDVTANISKITGKALYFDGINDHVSCGNAELLRIGSTNYTISLWVKTTDTNAIDMEIFAAALVKTNWWSLIYRGSTTRIKFTDDDDSFKAYIETAINLSDGVWHHIVAVQNYGTNHELFVDGVLIGTAANNGDSSNNNVVKIGGKTDQDHFKGKIQDVRIYNRNITNEEILELYNKKQTNAKGLIGHWSFNNTSDPGHDDSGNGNDGAVTGAVSTGGHNTTEDDITTARVTANDKYHFIPLAGNQVMMAHIEEA